MVNDDLALEEHEGRPVAATRGPGERSCGELVGYVDDGPFSYAHTDPVVLSRALTEKCNLLEEWMSNIGHW